MPTVTIYTMPTCKFCKQTKAFLNEHDVTYTEKDVSEDNDAAKEMIEETGQRSVPVTIVEDDNDNETIIGFDKDALQDTLDL